MLKKRVSAVLLAVLMLIGTCGMTACGRQNTPNSSDGSESGVSDDSSAPVAPDGSATDTLPDETEGPTQTDKNGSVVTTTKRQDNSSKGNNTTKASQGTATTAPLTELDESVYDRYKSDGLPSRDLKGQEFVIGTYRTYLVKPDADSDYNRAVLAAISQIEKRFNCKITVKEIDYGNSIESLMPKIVNGEKVADLLLIPMWETGNYIASNIAQDLSKVPHLQLSKPWYNQSGLAAGKVGGKQHFVLNNIESVVDNSIMIAFNKSIAKELGLDLYAMVDNKQWTLDAFVDACKKAKKDLNKDGRMDSSDRWGWGASEDDALRAFMTGAGLGFVSQKNGKYVFDLNNSAAVNTLKKIKGIFGSDDIKYPDAPNWGTYIQKFCFGQTLFFPITPGGVSTYLKSMEDDYGLIPFPTEKAGQSYRISVNHNTCATMIPITNKDTENTGLILEALSFAYWKLVPKQFDFYDGVVVRDDASLSNIVRIMDYSAVEDQVAIFSASNKRFSEEVMRPICQNIINKPNSDLASDIASVAKMGQQYIDEFYGQK